MELEAEDIPFMFDWRSIGGVTDVKMQGLCGGCYGFSASATIETALFKKTGVLQPLSAVQMLQCSTFGIKAYNVTTLEVELVTAIYEDGSTSVVESNYPYPHDDTYTGDSPVVAYVLYDLKYDTNQFYTNHHIDPNTTYETVSLEDGIPNFGSGGYFKVLLNGTDIGFAQKDRQINVYNNMGCDGGMPSIVYSFYKQNQLPLLPELFDPLDAQIAGYMKKCNNAFCLNPAISCDTLSDPQFIDYMLKNISVGIGARVIDWHYVDPCKKGECASINVARLTQAIWKYGALSTEVDSTGFESYTGGIMTAKDLNCSSDPAKADHAVVIVGYNIVEEYFTIRNSWGVAWGESGFIRLSSRENTCGIKNFAAYVEVEGVW